MARVVAIASELSVQVFDVGTGEQMSRLVPGGGEDTIRGFGQSLAIYGNTVAVGSPYADQMRGAVYLFDATTGEQTGKITAVDRRVNDQFGISVSLDQSHLLVGVAPIASILDVGKAYLFDVATQTQKLELQPPDPQDGAQFGYAVDLSDGVAIIGAWLDGENGTSEGSASLFDVATGSLIDKIDPADSENRQWFGQSVAISGDNAVIGSWHNGRGDPRFGLAYVIGSASDNELHRLTAGDLGDSSSFGESVDISGTLAIIGSSSDDENGPNSGAVYVFDLAEPEPASGAMMVLGSGLSCFHRRRAAWLGRSLGSSRPA